MRALLKALCLPPGSLFLLVAVGALLARRHRRAGRCLLWAAPVLGFVLSTPLVSGLLRRSLETLPALAPARVAQSGAQAIVVLGADFNSRADEWPGAEGTVGEMTLQRLRLGAALARASGLPVAVCGGTLGDARRPLARMMKEVLERELGCPVRWVEERSGTTWQNARGFGWIAKREGLSRVVLVTHAWHMPRARAAFEAAGLEVVPAPTDFRAAPRLDPRELLPTAAGLHESALALHEWLGRVWYRLFHTDRL